MRWIENTIRALSPAIDLEGTPWEAEWANSQRAVFTKTMLISLPLLAAVYIFHYYFFDKPEGLEPSENWLVFRMGAAFVLILTTVFYLSPLNRLRFYKMPGIIATALVGYSQAHVSLNYPPAPWIYPYIFVLAAVLLWRIDAFKSLAFSLLTMLFYLPVLIQAGIHTGTLVSATLVCCIIVILVRSSYSFEVTNFLLQKRNERQQELHYQLQEEFSSRIQSFIPRVISARIQHHVAMENVSVSNASLYVLKPQAKDIACLFSDIRGFTTASKDLENFVNESVIPEVKAVSAQIERNEGIPRKIGDLIFAYYDDNDQLLNLCRAILSGIQLSRQNEVMNATVSAVEIKRYILISSGTAVVGNIGGLDSSVEITALGSPVNFLSRLDETTKIEKLAAKLSPGDIILSPDTAAMLTSSFEIAMQPIYLNEIGVSVRDFAEVEAVYVIKPTPVGEEELANFISLRMSRNQLTSPNL